MCDKKNNVLFTDTECVALSSDYKLPNENYVLLRVSRENNMYNVDPKNVVSSGGLTCLFAKATLDESNLWHRSLGYINFKTMNKLVKGKLVRGLPSKIFENNHTCVACQKEKQHKALWIGPKWLFDINTLTMSMNYQPIVVKNQPNDNAGIKANLDAGKVGKETVYAQQYVLLQLWSTASQDPQNTNADVADAAFDVKEHKNYVHVSANGSDKTANQMHDKKAKREYKGMSIVVSLTGVRDLRAKFEEFSFNSSNRVNVVSAPVIAAGPTSTNSTNSFNTASPSVNAVSPNFRIARKSSFVDPSNHPDDPNMPELEDIVYLDDEEDVGAEDDLSNLETNIPVSPILTTRVHKDHPVNQIIIDLNSVPQTRSMTRMVKEQGGLHQTNDEDFHTCMFAYFLSQEEPKKVLLTLKDPSWIEAMQYELLQFKLQKVWILLYLPKGKRAIGSKWVFRNKKDERGIVIRNKARLVAQRHTQEEGIDYDEVFAPVARIEAIRLFLAYASFMGFMVYQMDVKSVFLYETIKEEVYVCQPPGFEDPDYPDKVYKVVKALYGLHQAPRAWYETLANYLLENGFQRGKIDQTLFIKKQKGDILLVQVYVDDIIFRSTNKELCKAFEKLMKDNQDKYVAEILRKFGFRDVKSASTPIVTEKPLLKDPDGKDVGVHIYRSMIGSLMYLTSSRTDIMFAICACARFQVTQKVSHLHAVKTIFSDYAGASLDRKSITGVNEAQQVSNESPLLGVNTPRCDEDSIELKKLMVFMCLIVKRTAWNEFNCSMASAVICLATGKSLTSLNIYLTAWLGMWTFQEDPPPEVPTTDNRTMTELLQAPTKGYEDAIVIPEIAANNFELKHGLINLVQNKQFFGYDKEDSHAHIRHFNKITSTLRVPNVPSSSIRLMLFPFSHKGAARIWLEKEPPRSILTWDDLVSKFINQFFPPSKMTNLRNEIMRFQQRFDESFYKAWDRFNDLLRAFVAKVSTSSSTLSISSEVAELKDLVSALILDKKNRSSASTSSPTPALVKAVEPNCVTCGGSGTLPSNTITNPKEELKGITTRSSIAYQGRIILTPSKIVKQGTEVTKDQVQTPSSQSTALVQPPVIQSETQTLISEPVVAPVSASMPNVKSSIPYPSRRDNERRHDQANEQIKKFYKIFKDMSFKISFKNALILMPKFASTLKALIGNKEKISEMARTPINKHCSVVILNNLPRKLRDPDKFLIPCKFPGMDECLALADIGASINLMPLSVWEALSLLELTLTCITLELADRSRCFLNIDRALIDLHKGELTLRIRNEAITYNLDQIVRYSANYNQITANKIDVIEMACEEHSQEVLGFFDVTASGNPTPYDDPIVSTTSPTLTPFGDSDFLLFEEADAFLGLEDDPNSPKINPFYYDPEGDILLLEAILNSKPLPPLPNHEQYLPSFKKELKVCEAKTI
nr:hypothetical protein [Tanacetum cinerariifolium]